MGALGNVSIGCTINNKTEKDRTKGIKPKLLWVHSLYFPPDLTNSLHFPFRSLNYGKFTQIYNILGQLARTIHIFFLLRTFFKYQRAFFLRYEKKRIYKNVITF